MPAGVRKIPTAMIPPMTVAVVEVKPSSRRNLAFGVVLAAVIPMSMNLASQTAAGNPQITGEKRNQEWRYGSDADGTGAMLQKY
jgi:hypothetical protein